MVAFLAGPPAGGAPPWVPSSCHYAGIMSTMNISLPGSLREFVEQQAAEKGFATSSEYVRDLIRRDRDRQHLRSLLRDGARSGPAGPADASYFAGLRAGIRSGQ